jgi:hypothetical protein
MRPPKVAHGRLGYAGVRAGTCPVVSCRVVSCCCPRPYAVLVLGAFWALAVMGMGTGRAVARSARTSAGAAFASVAVAVAAFTAGVIRVRRALHRPLFQNPGIGQTRLCPRSALLAAEQLIILTTQRGDGQQRRRRADRF